jgi:hypothetical protein
MPAEFNKNIIKNDYRSILLNLRRFNKCKNKGWLNSRI